MRTLLVLIFALAVCACSTVQPTPGPSQWVSTDPSDVNPTSFRAQIRVAGAGDFQAFYGPIPATYPVRYEGSATVTFQAWYPLVVVDGEGGFVIEPMPTPERTLAQSEAFMQQEMAAGRFLFRLNGRPVSLYRPGTIEARRAARASPYVAPVTSTPETEPAPREGADNLGEPPTSEGR